MKCALFLIPLFVSILAGNIRAQAPQAPNISAPEHSVIERRNEKTPMRDGLRLGLDLFLPSGDGPFPAILCQTPYNKDGLAKRAQWFAQRGYAVINSDSRGRFTSEGEWDPFSPLHKTDGYDLVEWIAKQPWCTGRVGSYGLSYMGWTQWWTATQAPPSLKCIVPEVAPPDQFYNGPYQNGILVAWAVDWAGTMSGRTPFVVGKGAYGGFSTTRDADYRQRPYLELDDRRKHGHTAWFDTWIHQNTASGDYWKAIAYQTPESYARVTVPSLAITGWFDANFPGSPMNFLAVKKQGATPESRRPRLVIGPWEHIINRSQTAAGVDFGPRAIIDWDGYVCRWFDQHLKQTDTGILDDPPVHVFVMGKNEWRSAADWPLPGTQFTKYHFREGHALDPSAPGGDEKPDHYTYDPNNPTPDAAFANGHIDGPRDVRDSAKRADVLAYTSPPLESDVDVVGPIVARLYAATSAKDTDWMVRLIDVHPDGTAAFLAEGIMRARHRDPEKDGAFNAFQLSTIEPEKAYPYTIEFWRPTGNSFAKGHRIRVEISSSYFPYYLPNLNTGEDNTGLATQPVVARQTIYHDREHPSHIVLPIIPVNNSAIAPPLIDAARRIADRVIAEDKSDRNYRADLILEALLELSEVTNEPRYREHTLKKAAARGWTPKSDIDFEGQSFSSLSYGIYQATKDRDWLTVFLSQSARCLKEEDRNEIGAVVHPRGRERGGGHAMLIDSAQEYFARMARAGKHSGDEAYFKEIAEQVALYRKILRNETTGLWHQGRGWISGKPEETSPGAWSRGHGWLLRGLSTAALEIPRDRPEFAQIQAVCQELADALLPLQQPSGLWPCLLSYPAGKSPLESSGTAMIATALSKLWRAGILPDDRIRDAARRAFTVLPAYVRADGQVLGVSPGPGPLESLDAYFTESFPPGNDHGTFALLFAASEAARFEKHLHSRDMK